MSYIGLQKFGKMRVATAVLNEYPDLFEKYVPEFKVGRVDVEDENTIVYTGTHPEFDLVDALLDDIPFYRFEFISQEDGTVKRLPVVKE
jgi:hypothetical protein